MTRRIEIAMRKAGSEDGRELARLMSLAGEGIPAFLWSRVAGPGERAMEVGARRVGRAQGSFSHAHAHVAVISGDIAGMLLGYRPPDDHDVGALDDGPDVVRPLLELEAQAPGSWYVNALATVEEHRGHGIGTRLMRLVEDLARASGAEALSLIVAEGNAGAVRLYRRLGYTATAHRRIVPFPGCPHSGRWILMGKPVPARGA